MERHVGVLEACRVQSPPMQGQESNAIYSRSTLRERERLILKNGSLPYEFVVATAGSLGARVQHLDGDVPHCSPGTESAYT